jgi:NAD(P)-dependent dehydrogenase (short-subunit alcohol dehydrogenase family)
LSTRKTAVITGGSSGIGLAIAQQLVDAGTAVLIVGRDAFAGAEAVSRLGGGERHAWFARADVTSHEQLEAAVASFIDRYGRLDTMFNNAGMSVIGLAEDVSLEQWREVIEIDLMGVVHGIAVAYPRMVRQGFGHIVNTSSLSGVVPTPGSVPYTAAKHAVVGLSLSLRLEARRHGIGVSVLCPPVVRTPILDRTPAIGLDPVKARGALPGRLMSARKCATVTLRAVARDQALILPGLSWPLALMQRHLPTITGWIADSIARKVAAIRQSPRQ